jgi:small nuclear ribonucleoprotein (snRNP)-like protein
MASFKNVWSGLLNKKVFIQTKSGRKYVGIIDNITPKFLFLIDKYKRNVCIQFDDLSLIQEEA